MKGRLLIDSFSQEQWTAYASTFLDNNLYQSWDYGAVHSMGKGRRVSRVVWMDDGRPLAMAQLRVKSIPFAKVGVAEVNWGPIWQSQTERTDPGLIAEFLKLLRAEFCEKQGLDLRVEPRPSFPDIQDCNHKNDSGWDGFSLNESLRPYRTIILDLSQGEEKLRTNFHGKWRNSLSQAERAGLEAECGSSMQHFDRFEHLYQEMWEQKKFSTGVRLEAIRTFQSKAPENCKLSIWIVKDNGKDIAAGVFSGLGNTMLYFLGASSLTARKNSNGGYLIQWLNIRRSIELGFRFYDLGGLTDSPDSGVDLFKNRMGGTRVVFPGWFESSATFWSLKTYSFLEKSFRTARAMSKRC